MASITHMKRGRKPLDLTPEKRAERLKESRAKAKLKTKNITLDAEVQVALWDVQQKLSVKLASRRRCRRPSGI